jgi:Uma2 family endonuclease
MLPAVCVFQRPSPDEEVFTTPPLIWIEILFPEDRPERVDKKVREVLAFGVPNVWAIDPVTLEAVTHTPHRSRKIEDGVLPVDGTPIEISLQAATSPTFSAISSEAVCCTSTLIRLVISF